MEYRQAILLNHTEVPEIESIRKSEDFNIDLRKSMNASVDGSNDG